MSSNVKCQCQNIDGNDGNESSNQENSNQEVHEKKLKKQENKLCHDTDKEPGEMSSMNSRKSHPGKKVQKTFPLAPFKQSDTNLIAGETPKKRVLSDGEQNYIKSSLSNWHQLYCQILPRGTTLPCLSDLILHLKRAHAKGSNYLLCGIDECVNEFTLHQKFRNLYTHIRKHHCTLKFSCAVC